MSFHPGRDAEAPFEIVRLYLEAGGKPDKCVMSHLDSKDTYICPVKYSILSCCVGTILDFPKLLEFAELGVYCQFDLFGTECSHYQLNPTSYMPSDYQRIENIIKLSKEGFTDRLLISHDIHTKHRLVSVEQYVAANRMEFQFSFSQIGWVWRPWIRSHNKQRSSKIYHLWTN